MEFWTGQTSFHSAASIFTLLSINTFAIKTRKWRWRISKKLWPKKVARDKRRATERNVTAIAIATAAPDTTDTVTIAIRRDPENGDQKDETASPGTAMKMAIAISVRAIPRITATTETAPINADTDTKAETMDQRRHGSQ